MYGDVLRIYAEIHKRIKSNNQYVSNAINAIIFATYYRLVSVRVTGFLLQYFKNSIQNYGNLFQIFYTEYTDSR